MGNKHTKPIATFSDWQKVQNQNDIEIYRNKKNNQLAEKRSVTIDPHYDLEDQLKIYHMRQNNNDSLVRAFGAEEVHKKAHGEGICSGHKKLQVLTEKMPYRLNELPQLTFPESLLFLRESLRAYYRVFKSYGPIHVTKKLIGINQFGEVKSWVNQNWALNHPNNDLPTLQSTKLQNFSNRSTEVGSSSEVSNAKYRDETEMVYNIVAVIEEKCEQGKFPKAFSEEVEQHSSSFRKLSTYLEDFIRVNELFIPPKINYETVFVSKYQTRLAEQHQQAGQQISGRSEAVQNQRILTTNGGGQSLGYNTAVVGGGYQQEGLSSQGLGYGTNVIQGQEGNQGGYTVTKTTTTTYGNSISPGIATTTSPITFTSSYQPSTYQSSYQAYQAPSSNLLASTNTLPASIPWQKSQSIYKLPEQPSQNTYSSSYYQYSTTNPSSVGVGSYKFGGPSTGEYMAESYKPLSYNSALGNSSGLQVTGATQLNGTQNYLNSGNQNVYTFTSLDNRFGSSQSDNPLSPYQNLAQLTNDRKTQFQTYTSSTPTKQSYEEFKKNFGQFGQGVTTNPTYNYSTTTYQKQNKYEPLVYDSAQKGSTFSFDGRSNLTTKFNEYAGGKGYSNFTGANADGVAGEGKYASEFNKLLGPMLNLRNQYESHKNQQGGMVSQGFASRESSTVQHA